MNKLKVSAIFLLIASISLFSTIVSAETKSMPKIISNALEKYQKEGADNLIPNLLIGSPIEGDKNALSQVNLLKQIETFYGKYINSELYKSISINQSINLIYFVMNYEKGPLYGSATVYNANGKEIVSTFNFHTDIKQIIPSELIFH